MSKCRTGCPTQDCGSWGACARNANFRYAGNWAATVNRDLKSYARAKSMGLQPAKSTHEASMAAIKASGA